VKRSVSQMLYAPERRTGINNNNNNNNINIIIAK
jgi:hypothetical protein